MGPGFASGGRPGSFEDRDRGLACDPNTGNDIGSLITQDTLNECNSVPKLALGITGIGAVLVPRSDVRDEPPQEVGGSLDGFLFGGEGNAPLTFPPVCRRRPAATVLGANDVHYGTRMGTTLRSPPSTRERTWSFHRANAAFASRS